MASLMLAVVFALPVATATQNPDPRTNVETAVTEAIRLLEAKEYVKFIAAFVPPDDLKRITAQGTSVEQFAQAMADGPRAGLLLSALKSVKDATPTFDSEGKTATYKLKEPVMGARDTLVFVKIDGFWYLRN
jgi:hypothetical protein